MNGRTCWNFGLVTRTLLVAAWGWGGSLSAQFVAFNEHLGGVTTHSNTTLYSVKPPSATNAGVLRNLTNGAPTGVTLTVTNAAGLSVGSTSGLPIAGSPAETVFGGRVTFGNGYINLGTNQTVAHVLSGLDPNRLYSLKGTTVRGNATSAFPNRWTVFELAGAAFWTNRHSAGCLTNGRPGVNLANNQVALATGDNRAGDLFAWEGIVPDASGVVVVSSRKFYGTNVPGVMTNDAAGFSYALETLRLEEIATSPPWLTVQPRDCPVWPGDSAELVAAAGGPPPLSYQWFKGLNPSNEVVGATNPTYLISAAVVADTGYYTLVVSNPFGTVSSRVALVTVLTNPPVFTSSPTNVTVFYGASAFFTARVSGSGPIFFQWFKDGAVIAGATNNFYTIAPTQVGDAGTFTVVANNRVGTASASATLTLLDTPLLITNQPQSQAGLFGSNVTFAVGVAGADRWFQWFFDGQPLPGATNATLTLSGLTNAHAGSYSVVVTNSVSSVTSVVALLTVVPAPGPDALNVIPSAAVWCLAVQPDGKILLGGDFTVLGGQSHPYFGRLNADGSLDATFSLAAGGGPVLCQAVQEGGKTLVGGGFTSLGGQSRSRFGRLNADGTLDDSFNPGAGSLVRALVVQPDGKIVVGGDFTTLGGVTRNRLGRLNRDGSLDAGFNPGADASVYALAAQADGKMLVAGNFLTVGGQTRSRLARLNPDGSIDGSFNPGANGLIRCLALQSDGGILVGGDFTTLSGQARERIGRVKPSGSVDAGFNPGASGTVYSLAVQADGTVLVAGGFGTLAGQPRDALGRLKPDGNLDGSFNIGVQGVAVALGIQADGKVLVGGSFTLLGAERRTGIARLNNTVAATQSLGRAGATLSWWRGGASPEVGRVTFEVLAPETPGWISTGAGVRIGGGWQGEGGELPPNSSVRTRGFVTGGTSDGSSWFVETVFSPPRLTGTVQTVWTSAGAATVLTAPLEGATPISCRWQKDGVDLQESAHWVGTHGNPLVIVNTEMADAGSYSVVLSNLLGQATGLVAQLVVADPFIAAQTLNPEVFRGSNFVWSITAAGTPPLTCQWYKNGQVLPQVTGTTLSLSNVQPADAGAFWVVVSNPAGSATSQVAHLVVLAPVTADSLNPRPDNQVYALAPQPDGKVLVGGNFSTLGSQSRPYLARLLSDGNLDPLFRPGPDASVLSLLVQPDGQILAGGAFTILGGQPRARLGRLHPDGSLDLDFAPAADGTIQTMALQADGQILLAGEFTGVNGQPRRYVARLKANGILDPSFDPGADNAVYCIAVQPDGKVLLGGTFTALAGQDRRHLGRLHPDGSLDASFNPGADSTVHTLAVQPNGQILVGGAFWVLAGQGRRCLGRLNADGTPDPGFNPGPEAAVYSLALQADGKALVGGTFTTLGGQTRLRLGRLNADGSLDGSFNPSVDGTVFSLAIQADGSVLVGGGSFGTLAGQSRWNLGRLSNTLPSTQSLSWSGAELTWLRGGTGPEIWRATLELSTDGGGSWTDLSPVLPVAGGWRYSGVEPVPNATIRVRGLAAGGFQSGSGGLVESFFGAPAVSSPPQDIVTNVGARLVLTAELRGLPPFGCRWQKDGLDLIEGAGLTGTGSNVLTLASLQPGDKGAYSLVVSNAGGVVNVLIATLRIPDPFILSQPASQIAWLGTNVSFVAGAGGTPPLSYQWFKGGVALPGATGAVWTVTNVQSSDDGSQYSLQVSNAWGTDLSTPALLTVVNPPVPDALKPNPNNTVYCLAEHVGGKILLGGDFTTLCGQPRTCLGRLNADGSLDTSFNPGPEPTSVLALTVQTDGRILVGGGFSYLGGQSRSRLGRLNPDGSLDGAFNPGADGVVRTFWVQEDGRILVGGDFTTLAGQTRNHIGRLYADGSLDPTFNPGADGPVYALAVRKGGSILVAGNFSSLAAQPRACLGHLNADGSLDSSFRPALNGTVRCLAERPDGTLLIGGDFTALDGWPCGRIARLQSDGARDSTYSPFADGSVYSIVAQVDGRVLVGGSFAALAGQPRNGLGRLNPDGGLDASFNPGANGPVWALGLQDNGRLLVGGAFSTIGGTTRSRFARLANTQPATGSLTLDATTATWRRGGTCPELAGTMFGVSTNGGATWVELGTGVSVPGGWEFTGLEAWPGAAVRARGLVMGGTDNASIWFVESRTGAPTLNTEPRSLLTNAGATVVLSAAADGSAPLAWQWRKDGLELSDGERLLGARGNALVISNAQVTDAGNYTVAVSNSHGWVIGLVVQLTIADPFIAVPPADWLGSPGNSAFFSVQTLGSAPLSYQWYRQGLPVSGATAATLALPNLLLSDDGSRFTVVVSNSFGSVTSLSAGLRVVWPVVLDPMNPSPNGTVYSLAVQADRKILLGGNFSILGGQPRNCLGRLLPDGTLDDTFTTPADGLVYCLALPLDRTVLLGGDFGLLAGQTRSRIGRLNPDGSLDTSFNPGANGTVYALAVQPDGKILLAGNFSTLAGQNRSYLGRLSREGSLDPTFNPTCNSTVYSLALQPDGKILVGGAFASLANQPRDRLGRLNSDGSLDTSFNPGADGTVYSLALQPDGTILVGGSFSTLGTRLRARLGRLQPDGAVEAAFNPGADSTVYSLALQTDGKLLVGGDFYTLGGQTRLGLARLEANGGLDVTFKPGAGGPVRALGLQSDGQILVGGSFTLLGGAARVRFGRLSNTAAATQSLTWTGSTVTWLRGGAGPETGWTTFDLSTNGGTTWANVGAGVRLPGGWQLTGLDPRPNASVRARGFVTGAHCSGSGWFTEARTGAPLLTTQPTVCRTNLGATLLLTLAADGSAPLSWQWQKDGVDLSDGDRWSGTRSNVLSVTNLQGVDSGSYSVRLSNSFGTGGGLVATVTVLDPMITTQPTAQSVVVGHGAFFQVQALGTLPLAYQWYQGGNPLPGATSASLSLAATQWSDDGSLFSVVVRNATGSVTSAVVRLSLIASLVTLDPLNPSPNGTVWSLAVQPDGKILLGGDFTTVSGARRNYLARVNADGSLDPSFSPGSDTPSVLALAVLRDGKILVAGTFSSLGGQTHNRLGRLNPDGTLDSSFTLAADGTISALLPLPDGRVLVGGDFTTLDGQARLRLARLKPDGSVEASFGPNADGRVYSMSLQPDGKIVVGGAFTTLGGQARRRLARLNPDGSLDPNFNPGTDGMVQCVAVQPDGRILLGGNFTTVAGQTRLRLARLQPDGSLENPFNPGADSTVYSIVLQADGQILVGGAFVTLGGQARSRLGRLTADGSLETLFNPGTDATVYALGAQADGSVVVGGGFTNLAGVARSRLGRLKNTVPATQSLAWNGPSVTWRRGGASPEVSSATLEVSTNHAASWLPLGTGRRVSGGWEFAPVEFPPQSTVRVRGWVTGGSGNGSSWFLESLLVAPSRPRFATGLDLHVSNGQLHLRLLDVPTLGSVVLEASPDLQHGWTPVSTNPAPAAVLDYTDALGTNRPRRFYRALWQEP